MLGESSESEEGIESLLRQMTIQEKCDLFAGRDDWHIRGVPRLGIPDVRVTDCGHGVTPIADPPINGTCFPTGVGQASTWNKDLIEEMGRALGQETQALGNGVLLGPKITLHRLPIGGRNFETYSEDPVLAGKLGAALVRGIQSQGVAACVKAFTCNNQQMGQTEFSAEVDERTLREIYFRTFRIAIEESDPLLLMTSYNMVNGEYPSGSQRLLSDLIKGEWTYRGAIVSDWRAVHGPESIAAGLDLEMPGPGNFMRKEDFLRALEAGIIDEEEVDDRAARILRVILHAEKGRLPEATKPNAPSHNELARKVAEESIVLLKNEADVLPFDRTSVRKVAVIGPNSTQARLGGGGSASVCPPYSVSPVDGIEALLGGDVEVVCQEGSPLIGSLSVITSRNLRVPDGDDMGLEVEYFKNQHFEGEPFASDVVRQVNFSWGWASPIPGFQVHAFAIRWSGRLLPSRSGIHKLGGYTTGGGFRLYLDGQLVLDRWGEPAGEGSGKVLEDAFVEVDLTAGQPVELCFEYNKRVHSAAVRLEWQEPDASDSIAEAAELAAESDAVILCTGISNSFEGGARDRDGMCLPGGQDRLIKEVLAANPNTVIVLNSGTPLDMSRWVDDARAIVQAWYPGQEGGNALARILFGDVNPSGKLPVTLPVRAEDSPAWSSYPGENQKTHYGEGIFVGYRHFDEKDIEPLFAFGHGLSYSDFQYSNLRLSSETMKPGETLDVCVDVTNMGIVAGKESIQLYVSDLEASVPRPVRELRDFAKIDLQPGQTRTARFTLDETMLAFYDVEESSWRVEDGIFEVMCGSSSRKGLTARFSFRQDG